MKQNHTGLFMMGIVVGGTVMLLVLALIQIPNRPLPAQAITLTATPEDLPQLIALEPTGVRQKTTPTQAFFTPTSGPAPTASQIAVSVTPTPLILLNKQQSEIIGNSVGDKPLTVYTFGEGEQERMIVAGIHGGDEWNTVTLANQLIKYVNQNPNTVPENVTLYILPDLNPDGEARAHNKYGHLNENHVDLNRNFPVNWKQDWERDGCWNYLPSSGGTGPGSEPETQALMSFIEEHNIQVLISYHSAALGIFPGGLPWDGSSTRLAKSIAEVTSYRFPPLDTGCAYSGTLADYAISKGMAAVDLELTNHIDPDFDQNLDALTVLLNFVP